MFARAKGKRIRQLQCQEQCIDHIPYYLSGLSRAHFSPTTFLEIAVDITDYVTFNNHARGCEERGRQEKRNTACLFCLAPSITRLVIFVSRAFSLDGVRKKKDCR